MRRLGLQSLSRSPTTLLSATGEPSAVGEEGKEEDAGEEEREDEAEEEEEDSEDVRRERPSSAAAAVSCSAGSL